MTRTVTFTVLLAVAATTLSGCSLTMDVGPRTTEERGIDAVDAVLLQTSGTVRLTRGDEPGVTITAGEQVISHLTTEVRDGVLVLATDGTNRLGGLGGITYDVVLPEVVDVHVQGSGEVSGDDVTGADLVVTVEGSGEVELFGVEADALDLRIAGSGEVELAGRADTQQVAVDGSGDYDGGSLDSREADVTVRGSGSARVEVTGTLDATVEGSGEIVHSGGAEVSERVSGSGDIDRM